MPLQHCYGKSIRSGRTFILAIRRNLLIGALCWLSLGIYGLSLLCIIQGALFVALLISFISSKYESWKLAFNDFIRNWTAAVLITAMGLL